MWIATAAAIFEGTKTKTLGISIPLSLVSVQLRICFFGARVLLLIEVLPVQQGRQHAAKPVPLITRYFDSLPVPLPAIMHVRACPIPLTALECILSTINIIIIFPVMEAMMK